ncbi:MAG: ABC transporter ATP-binding protein [Akkermansiaceae bacterium]
MKRFFPYYRYLLEVKWYFLLAVLAGVGFGVATGLGMPLMMKTVLPELFKGDEVPWVELIPVAMILPAAFIARGVFDFINGYYIQYCGIRVLERIQVKVFGKLQYLSVGFFNSNKSGDLLSRLMNDPQMMRTVLVNISNDLIKQPMVLLSALTYLVIQSFEHGEMFFLLVCLATIPLCVFPIRILGKRLKRKARKVQNETGDITATVTDSLQAPQEIRAYNMQEKMISTFRGRVLTLLKARMKVVKYDKMVSPSVEIISSFGIAITILYAGRSGMEFDRDLMPLLMALYLCYDPIKVLGKVSTRVQEGLASLDRVEYILNHDAVLPDPEKPLPLDVVEGEVRFENVSFGYKEKQTVLKGLNVTVPKGQVVALVGPSGAGKTTFASLIPRFFDVTKGVISVDGYDTRAVMKEQLRNGISLVSQSPVLFNDSVMENIRIGRPGASDAQVVEAAKKAHADQFIREMDGGQNYLTSVGEKGSNLSGGQRQRIAIARAFLKDAPILIMDEATSALDSESEAKIQGELEELVKGRTTFIIAHRFSTIKICDRILVFNDGEVVADGSHDQIYDSCPLYRDLYDRQSG